MRSWDSLIEKYLRACQARGLMESTIAGRERELHRFRIWLSKRRPRPRVEDVDGEMLTAYIRSRTTFHSKSSVGSVVSILRGFGEFLLLEGVWIGNPMRWIQGPKLDPRARLPRRITRSHQEALWRAAATSTHKHTRYIVLCLLSVLYATGIRRGELERLRVSDWDHEKGILRIDGRKTGQERSVPVGRMVWSCMEVYLPHRHNILEKTGRLSEERLFISSRGTPLCGQRISILIHKVAKRADVPLVTLHQFRHSCASDLLEEGIGIAEVQKILGHACIESTARYTHVADPKREEAARLHPVNDFLGWTKDLERRAS